MKSSRVLLAATLLSALCACDEHDGNGAGGSRYGSSHIWGTDEAVLADGPASMARFSNPANVAVGIDGTVYVADFDNNALRAIGTDGVAVTILQREDFQRPFGLTVAADGTLYIETDANDAGARDATTGTVWKLDRSTGAVTVVARNLGRPRGLLALPDGRIALSDLAHDVIALLNPTTGAVTALAGLADQAGFVDDSGAAARFSRPYGMALADDGALLVADQNNNAIRKVTLAGVVSTFAGGATAGSVNGPVASARFTAPEALATSGGAVYVADQGNHLIRKIAAGVVSTQAGNGSAGFVDAQGTAAEFFGLEGISAGSDGKLWIADGNVGDGGPYNRVRFIPIP